MGMSVLGVSLSSLSATLAGIRTTQHNIANASTPGYHRQEVQQSAGLPQFLGNNYFGTGVSTDNVVRIYNRFLDNELRTYQGQEAGREVYSAYASQVDSLLGNASSNLDTALQNFFAAVNAVANDPTAAAPREQMLSEGKNLAGRMNLLGGQLENLSSTVNLEINSAVDQINAYVQRIAQLNSAIGYSASQSQAPNDLIDQRDQQISDLNKLINVTQVQQSDGSVGVFLGNGQPLVVGASTQKLKAVPDPKDPSIQTMVLETSTGSQVALNTSQLTDGRLGGLLAFRDEVLQPSLKDLGRLVISLADQFNTQHATGFDLTGTPGGNFFGSANSLLRPPIANSANTGTSPTFTLSLSNSNNLTSSDYQLQYDGGTTLYSLVRLSDNTTLGTIPAVGGSITADGLALTVTGGSPGSGDSWLLRPTSFAAGDMSVVITLGSQIAAAGTATPGDNSNAVALANLQTSLTMSGSTTTFSGAYNQLATRNAILAGNADADLKTFSSLALLTQDSQQSVSGVNLDEEAAKLIQYQQAYQAAARSMQIAASLLDEILAIQ